MTIKNFLLSFMKKITKNLYIFKNYINNKNTPIVFDKNKCDVGQIKYLPPVSKQWKNNICLYNLNNLKNLPIYDLNINSLIKAYFKLYLKYKFLQKRYLPLKYIHRSLNKIYTSKAELNHNNNKAIITIYTYNREKIILLKKLKNFQKFFYKIIIRTMKIQDMLNINQFLKKLHKARIILKYIKNNSKKRFFIKKILCKRLIIPKSKRIELELMLKRFRRKLNLLKRFKLILNLNQLKFEETFLSKLSELLSKLYNKKVEFNIVNLKSIVFNTDLFTNILALQIKKKKARVLRRMKFALNKATLPMTNNIIERSVSPRTVEKNLINNKFKDLHLQSIINNNNNNNLDEMLNEIYPISITNNNSKNILNYIFNSIKYKNMGGIRIEVGGRLTKRYRADKAIYKLLWKGGLKNIDSSYKRLSSVIFRGSVEANLEYSMYKSKRRIGAFAVKGWISGK